MPIKQNRSNRIVRPILFYGHIEIFFIRALSTTDISAV